MTNINLRTGMATIGGLTVPATAAAMLAAERAQMAVTRLQARLALGPVTCAALDAMASDTETPWAVREIISHAQTWERNHPDMDVIGWVLGYDARAIDRMFRLAATL
jgi:hypothetical protein